MRDAVRETGGWGDMAGLRSLSPFGSVDGKVLLTPLSVVFQSGGGVSVPGTTVL